MTRPIWKTRWKYRLCKVCSFLSGLEETGLRPAVKRARQNVNLAQCKPCSRRRISPGAFLFKIYLKFNIVMLFQLVKNAPCCKSIFLSIEIILQRSDNIYTSEHLKIKLPSWMATMICLRFSTQTKVETNLPIFLQAVYLMNARYILSFFINNACMYFSSDGWCKFGGRDLWNQETAPRKV